MKKGKRKTILKQYILFKHIFKDKEKSIINQFNYILVIQSEM